MEVTQENIDIIVNLIRQGNLKKNLPDLTGFTQSHINRCLRALDNPHSSFYNKKLYVEIEKKAKENVYQNLHDLFVECEITQENIDIIVNLVLQKYSCAEISEITKFKVHYIYNCIKEVHDKNSIFYNQKLSTEIKKIQLEIQNERRVSQDIYYEFNQKTIGNYETLVSVANGTLSIEEGAIKLKMLVPEFIHYIEKSIFDEELLNQLKPMITTYLKEHEPKNVLCSLPKSVQKEILIMALTYRASFALICEKFNTTLDDVYKSFYSFKDLEHAVNGLYTETIGENATCKKMALANVNAYWKVRNQLIKNLNSAKTQEEKIECQKQIKLHQILIDDTKVFHYIKMRNNELTLEDRNNIARFCLKYYLPSIEAEMILHSSRNNIKKNEDELAAVDPIYAEKLNLKRAYFQEVNEKIISHLPNSMTPYEESNLIRGGGIR